MNLFSRKPMTIISADEALPGRDVAIPTAETHFVNGRALTLDVPDGMEVAIFGMGCFWGVERMFWGLDGVHLTMVGYGAGHTPNPTYHEVCTGQTGHNELVRVVYDPSIISFDELLRVFWEGHDPTQGMRQGNDRGHPVPQRHLLDDRGAKGRGRGQPYGIPTQAGGGRIWRNHVRGC